VVAHCFQHYHWRNLSLTLSRLQLSCCEESHNMLWCSWEFFCVQKASWIPDNCKPSLQTTKSSFSVLSACFLCLEKLNLFLCFGALDGVTSLF
jgi:hypothetical protein